MVIRNGVPIFSESLVFYFFIFYFIFMSSAARDSSFKFQIFLAYISVIRLTSLQQVLSPSTLITGNWQKTKSTDSCDS